MKEAFSNNELEKRLKREAEQFSLQPSDEVWDRISEQLRPQRNLKPWLWTSAAILLLLIGSYFMFLHTPSENHHPVEFGPASTNIVKGGSGRDKTHQGENKNSITTAPKTSSSETDLTKQSNLQTETHINRPPYSEENTAPSEIASTADKTPSPSQATTVTANTKEETGLPVLSSLPVSIPSIQPIHPEEIIPFLQVKENPAKIQAYNKPAEDGSGRATQATDKKVKKKRNITYTASLTSGVGYRILHAHSSPNYSQQMDNTLGAFAVVRNNKIDQKPDWNMSAEFRVAIPFGQRWSFQTGLSVLRTGYRVKAFGTYPAYIRTDGSYSLSGSTANTNSYYALNARLAPTQKPAYIRNRYLFGELPLMIGYQFGQPDKVHIDVSFGGGLLYLINSSPIIYSPSSGRYFTDKALLKPVNGILRTEAEVVFSFSKKMNFIVGPSLQYQMLSSYKNYPQVKEYPYAAGIKIGLQWLK